MCVCVRFSACKHVRVCDKHNEICFGLSQGHRSSTPRPVLCAPRSWICVSLCVLLLLLLCVFAVVGVVSLLFASQCANCAGSLRIGRMLYWIEAGAATLANRALHKMGGGFAEYAHPKFVCVCPITVCKIHCGCHSVEGIPFWHNFIGHLPVLPARPKHSTIKLQFKCVKSCATKKTLTLNRILCSCIVMPIYPFSMPNSFVFHFTFVVDGWHSPAVFFFLPTSFSSCRAPFSAIIHSTPRTTPPHTYYSVTLSFFPLYFCLRGHNSTSGQPCQPLEGRIVLRAIDFVESG